MTARLDPSSLSVIIPTLNESATIGDAVRHVREAGVKEVIVVDGGSSDGGAEIARAAGAMVVEAPRGRGPQQNVGARRATGEALLFLHADTRLPRDFPRRAMETLNLPGVSAGAFRFKVDDPSPALRLVERGVALRCRLLQMPFGDQAIFVGAETFRRAGGFPDAPILEDYELIRRLQKLGRIAIADGDAVTSARRWKRLGVFRATFTNQLCLLAYRLHVAPERIARWRGAGGRKQA